MHHTNAACLKQRILIVLIETGSIVSVIRDRFDDDIFTVEVIEVVLWNENAAGHMLGRCFQRILLCTAGIDLHFILCIPAQHELGKCAHIAECIVHHFGTGISVQPVVIIIGIVLIFIVIRQSHCMPQFMDPCAVETGRIAERPASDAQIARPHAVKGLPQRTIAGAGPPVVIACTARQRHQQSIHHRIAVRIIFQIIDLAVQRRECLTHQHIGIIHIISDRMLCGIAVNIACKMQSAIRSAFIISGDAVHRISMVINSFFSECERMDFFNG